MKSSSQTQLIRQNWLTGHGLPILVINQQDFRVYIGINKMLRRRTESYRTQH